ncbi:MAG: YlxR family protein [Myxococcaceae bacterium]|nr:YlxR family protein [Myxococcaceae bacterium]MBH2006409.1 YlxR family protein [Myxococcaceae bacterium]
MSERSCIGCRKIKSKADLFRFARRPDGTILLDSFKQFKGRGCYTCNLDACLKQAIHKKGFGRAFKKPVLGISRPLGVVENGESTHS